MRLLPAGGDGKHGLPAGLAGDWNQRPGHIDDKLSGIVPRRVVFAYQHVGSWLSSRDTIGAAVTRSYESTANRFGVFPYDLGEVAGSFREEGLVVIILAGLLTEPGIREGTR